jgi:hypothetical protein
MNPVICGSPQCEEKKMRYLSRTFVLICLAACPLVLPAGAADAADPAAIKVVLRSDSGNLLARCNNCISRGAYPDNAAVHVAASQVAPAYAQFYLQRLASGKYALQSVDSGNYLARCNNCIPGGSYPDSAFMHVTPAQLAGAPWAHFTLERLSNGKYALKADSERYLARCHKCAPDAAKPDNAFVHVTAGQLMSAPWAQWDVIVIP